MQAGAVPLVLVNRQAASTDTEKSTLTTLNFPHYLDHRKKKGKAPVWKVSFVSEGNNKLILSKTIRSLLWKAFFLDLITSTAVVRKKHDFPSCCLQTTMF